MKKKTAEEVANNIIDELKKAGLTFDEMLKVIQLAKQKYSRLKK